KGIQSASQQQQVGRGALVAVVVIGAEVHVRNVDDARGAHRVVHEWGGAIGSLPLLAGTPGTAIHEDQVALVHAADALNDLLGDRVPVAVAHLWVRLVHDLVPENGRVGSVVAGEQAPAVH